MILRSVLDHNADTHSHTQIDAYSHTHTHAKLPRCSLSRLDDDTALLHVVCVCVSERECVRVCVRVCVGVCVRVCVGVCVSVSVRS